MSRINTELRVNAAATRESFRGTLAFGRLVLGMLFLAGLLGWVFGDLGREAFSLAIVATALAYAAQFLYTAQQDTLGALAQLACLLSAIGSFFILAFG